MNKPISKTVDSGLYHQLLSEAGRSARNRHHFNLHPQLDDPIQRLCVAAEPGAYIQPHRHAEHYKWEMFIILKGQAAVLIFDEFGTVTQRTPLAAVSGPFAAEIAPLVWHTLVITAPQSLLMEIKPGPYAPLSGKDFAAWAPKEGETAAAEFEKWMRQAKVGQSLPGR